MPIGWLSVSLLLSACAVGPDFQSPKLADSAMQNGYRSLPSEGEMTKQIPELNFLQKARNSDWWRSFNHPQINAWVEQAVRKSPSARFAKATLDQARAVADGGDALLYPQIDVKASSTWQKVLVNPSLATYASKDPATTTYTLHNVGVQVSYNLDLSGGIRRADESRQAQFASAQWEAQAALNTLAGNVVTTAINLASTSAQVRELENQIALYESQLKIVLKQRAIGIVSDVEVTNFEQALANAKVQLPSAIKNERSLQNQLAVFIGEYPSDQAIASINLADIAIPSTVPILIPSELIRARPDIQMAEASLHQASANVGIATARYFPQIGISASGNSVASTVANLLNINLWNAALGITQTLFSGGAIRAQKAQADAGLAMAWAQYEKTTLAAFAQVSNTLTNLEQDTLIWVAQNRALGAAEQNWQLAQKRYRAGAISHYETMSLERAYQGAKINQIQAQSMRLSNMVALLMATGSMADFSTTLNP